MNYIELENAYESMENKFENLEVLYYGLVTRGHDYELTYNGKGYFLSNYGKKSEAIFTIGRTWLDESPFQYDTFDELLDGFKEGEKSLREFAPDIEELRQILVTKQGSCDLTYKGNVYFLCRYPVKSKTIFTIATNHQNENPFEYDTFDEMLDGFRETGGKTLREFILEAEILYEY